MKKYLIFLITLYLLNFNVFSQEYFQFKLNRNFFLKNDEIIITFNFNLVGYDVDDFKIRPVVDKGTIEIYDSDKDVWVKGNDLWTNMPLLEKEMALRTTLGGSSNLSFQIQNILTSEIYETSSKEIWCGDIYGDYVSKLNKNIKTYALRKEDLKNSLNKNEYAQDTVAKTGLLAKMIKYIDEII